MLFDISKIDMQDVVNANKMLRISTNVVNKHLKCADTEHIFPDTYVFSLTVSSLFYRQTALQTARLCRYSL